MIVGQEGSCHVQGAGMKARGTKMQSKGVGHEKRKGRKEQTLKGQKRYLALQATVGILMFVLRAMGSL